MCRCATKEYPRFDPNCPQHGAYPDQLEDCRRCGALVQPSEWRTVDEWDTTRRKWIPRRGCVYCCGRETVRRRRANSLWFG